MKKICTLILIFAVFFFNGCSNKYILNEETFFKVMTNIQYYPQSYIDKSIEFDCFTYELIDVNGKSYMCGVRKCSAKFGCTCGNDTIIGFILNSDVDIPKPKNQSEDTNDKTWVHIKGYLTSSEKTSISIYAYKDGEIDYQNKEVISMLTFNVEEITLIEDYSNLKYYVTK